jgi:hypothetical protein
VRRAISKLRVLLPAAVLPLLCGCVAGFAPIVGHPNGQTEKPPRLIASSSPTDGETLAQIYEQEVEHNYRLLLSPDGGRASFPLKSSYHYLVQIGDQPKQELRFLRSKAGRLAAEEEFIQIHFVGGEKWVGYGRCAGAPEESSAFWELQSDAERERTARATSRYFISVFSPKKILSRKVVTTLLTPDFQYVPAVHALRFHGPGGWMLYMIDERRIVRADGAYSGS